MPIEKRGWAWAAIPIDVLLSKELYDLDVRVYGYILWRAGQKSKAWPGIPKMAADLHRDEKTIRRSIQRLLEQHWIKRYRRFGRSTITYIFERQSDCLAFNEEQHPSTGEVEIIRSGHKSPIRTDVRSGHKSPIDQGTKVRSIRAQKSAGNNSKKNKIKQNGEWMNNDPICVFLRGLPGYNPEAIEEHRTTIVQRGYTVEALTYLWDYAQDRATALDYDNPVGLLLKMIDTGQQAPAYLDLIAERKRQAEDGEQAARVREEVTQRAASATEQGGQSIQIPQPKHLAPDDTVTDKRLQLWHNMTGELGMDLRKETYEQHVRPAHPISVNGNWTIAVPEHSLEMWKRLDSTLKRIYHGYTNQQTEFVYVKDIVA